MPKRTRRVNRLDLEALDDPARETATETLESGGLVVLPRLAFPLTPEEEVFLDPALLKRGVKNISFNPANRRVSGARAEASQRERLGAMLARYRAFAERVMGALAPSYAPALQAGRTTFRPGPVETRVLSARRDDRRLHLDAFAAKPVQGRRILRLFTNVDPGGRDRVWELGEEGVEALAFRYRPPLQSPGLKTALEQRLGLIRGRRTAYDAAMLALHDRAKLDDAWQASTPRTRVNFPPGSTWAVFTDGVSHAALSGRNAFEQTWLLPVHAMTAPDRSPLRTLETMAGRPLA